ncbi:hypothetical protein RUM44_002611 [Polyplax serrata]|uniref:Uncharacterized protein n=1 Tax=Polyplax serrata TaxID=468196 RepID=A0ABR1AF89_POLSC
MIGNLSSGFLLQNTKEYIEKLEYQKQALTNLVRHMLEKISSDQWNRNTSKKRPVALDAAERFLNAQMKSCEK